MNFEYPNQSDEIKNLNIELYIEHRLYIRAVQNKAPLPARKEIRRRIKILKRQLTNIKIVNLGLEHSLQ